MNRYQFIEDQANNLVAKYNTRDPYTILKNLGVEVLPFKGKTKLLGMYTHILNTSFVFYNPDSSYEMKKMVFAHELGHYILHQEEALKDKIFEFELFNIENSLETEANLFASHLLVDQKEVLELASLDYTYDQIAASLNVNVNLLLFKISEMNRKQNILKSLPEIDNKFLRS